MKLFGLTGGIGTGKSTAAKFLSSQGVPVVDTDDLAREVVAPGEPALREVAAAFGSGVIDSSGALDRKALADIVFVDPARRQRLEAILHPRIRQRWLAAAGEWRKSNVSFGVVVIPLLFETNAQTHFEAVICTACSAATQRERLSSRSWSAEQMENRVAAQWPLQEKIAASQYVVWTEGSLEIHHRQLAVLLKRFAPA